MSVRVLVVDDHSGVRALIRRVLEDDGFDVVGEAGDGAEALDAAAELRPDLVVMDVVLPGADGIDVAAEMERRGDAPPVILTSSRDPADLGPRLESARALGFVRKRDLSGAALSRLLGGEPG
ncbi:MAG TPA: response regulator [Miltoncostaeaceae bacterium]|nr:response regulator [Miltoncostaeaceae bacterium]